MAKCRNTHAFTLIELIVVLVIITIGAGISIPRITAGIGAARFRGAVSEVVTFLRDVHLDAVVERRNISISVDYKENSLLKDGVQMFKIPPDIIVNPAETDDYQTAKFTFYNNGRGTGPRMEFVDSNERMATVYVDLISGLAKCDLK